MTTPPMAHPRVAAGALLSDANGQVLLVKPTYKDGYDIPGGYVEPGETPLEACLREIQEELGVERTVDRLLVADWAPSEREGDKLPFVFDGGLVTPEEIAAFDLQATEIERVELHPAAALDDLMPKRLAVRLHAAIEARGSAETQYLEHGQRATPAEPDWWATDDVAEYLQVSTSTVRAYIARNQMPAPERRLGGRQLWRPATIREWHSARPKNQAS